MTFEELFRGYWWLMFPIFGMVLAVWGMMQTDARTRNVLKLIKSYTDQGKDPPPELIKLATEDESHGPSLTAPNRQNSSAWTFVVFAALAAGFGVGWYMLRGDGAAFAFATVAVAMGVMAVGALFILLFSRK